MSTPALHSLLSPRALLALAGERSYERGLAYRRQGRVRSLDEADGKVSANVEGTEPYHVRLWLAAGRVEYDCSCPMGLELRFCKHCVAAALAWTDAGAPALAAAPADRAPDAALDVPAPPPDPVPDGEIRTFLERHSREELIALMLESAEESRRLRTKLQLRAVTAGGGAANVKRLTRAVDAAFRTGDFVDYGRAPSYAGRIMETLNELRGLLDHDAAALVELVEHAAARAERAVEDVDDSDGWFDQIFGVLADLHLEACERARPDPVALAGRLFERELHAGYDIFHAALNYAEVLGPAGLAEYRARAEREWEKVPALGPGDREGHSERYRITRVMEGLAGLEEGVEPLVEVMRRDLSSSYRFLKIAELYRDTGDHAQAAEWAEAGLAAFPGAPDSRLRMFLAGVHQAQGRHAEAMELVWAEFAGRPRLDGYRALKEHAELAGGWPEWRDRALALVRERSEVMRAARGPAPGWALLAHDPGYSTLVRIYLWEERVDDAWAAAGEGGCSEDLWFELARRREAEHPADAIPIYKRRVDAKVSTGSNQGYEDGVRLLGRLRSLYQRASLDPERFGEYVASVRASYRRKRNFIKLLEAARLP